ncbi:AAA family ATPase [Ovoidimarina sediminis]|uniref:AAA family ATPase n=1 Tax=Ovoidimarina sediminis TaxID=3079856 RepID=UPI002914D45A|nr:AAA family ATPase [Rhodophyticola sp. MJ-SS7]MDU8945553.1 AAA family ATPase [Rhodophyticola sp. MJ-SS7]
MTTCVLITGCSGGGKSTLLAALREAGERCDDEPGRRIVAEARAGTGAALAWVDPLAFARRAVEVSRADLEATHRMAGRVFFDRGPIDAAVALEHAGGACLADTLLDGSPYADPVFLAPPWPEIFATDDDRPHGFAAAAAECARIERALDAPGHRVLRLPKAPVAERVAFVRNALKGA